MGDKYTSIIHCHENNVKITKNVIIIFKIGFTLIYLLICYVYLFIFSLFNLAVIVFTHTFLTNKL